MRVLVIVNYLVSRHQQSNALHRPRPLDVSIIHPVSQTNFNNHFSCRIVSSTCHTASSAAPAQCHSVARCSRLPGRPVASTPSLLGQARPHPHPCMKSTIAFVNNPPVPSLGTMSALTAFVLISMMTSPRWKARCEVFPGLVSRVALEVLHGPGLLHACNAPAPVLQHVLPKVAGAAACSIPSAR